MPIDKPYIYVEAEQYNTQYRVMDTYSPARTYPIPTPSAVIGMLHHVCHRKKLPKLGLCIIGESAPVAQDLATKTYFSNMPYTPAHVTDSGKLIRGYHQKWALNSNGVKIGLTKGPAKEEIIPYIHLKIFVFSDDKSELACLKDGLENPFVYPSLGRHGDLLNLLSVQWGHVVSAVDDVFQVTGSSYEKADDYENLISGIEQWSGNIAKYWHIVGGLRDFKQVPGSIVKDKVVNHGYVGLLDDSQEKQYIGNIL